MAVESEHMSPPAFLLLHFGSSSSSRTALQCQRLHKDDQEEAQGDDELSIGIVHLGTERGAVRQERKEGGAMDGLRRMGNVGLERKKGSGMKPRGDMNM